jgi:hypothetical protein
MYTNSQNKVIIQNLDNEAFSWFTRINSRLTLPYNWSGRRERYVFGPKQRRVEIANYGYCF